MLLHHIAVSSSFALGAILQTYLFELAVALLTEVNSIFLHLRTLLKVSGGSDIKTTSSYRLVALANIATFFTCRFEHFSLFFFCLPFCRFFYGCGSNYNRQCSTASCSFRWFEVQKDTARRHCARVPLILLIAVKSEQKKVHQ